MPYTIIDHKHRFSAWAAGRAATVKGCRFTAEQAKLILESSGLKEISHNIENLPVPDLFDSEHRIWRLKVIEAAENLNLPFTHGVAAKLINIYLKSIFVCGSEYKNRKVKAIHPPIDSVLLEDLYQRNIGGQKEEWQKARKTRWSKFNSTDYENVILAIKKSIPNGNGLWTIEEYWQGFQ